MPGTQDGANRGAMSTMEQVQRRAVGVSVDQQLGRGIVDPLLQLAGIGIHQIGRCGARVRLALCPGVGSKLAPGGQILAQKGRAPGVGTNLLAKTLIVGVGDALGITVQQHRSVAKTVQLDRFLQQPSAAAVQPGLTDQKVAIARQEGQLATRVAGLSQQRCHVPGQRRIIVVADPGLEQVAEDGQRLGATGPDAQPVAQQRQTGSVIQVQVRDVQLAGAVAGPGSVALGQGSTSTFWIRTGLLGRFWNSGERAEVGMALILSTTSVPSTTLPKTA